MERLSYANMAEALGVTEVELTERVGSPRPLAKVHGCRGGIVTVAEVSPCREVRPTFLTAFDLARLLVAVAGERAAEILSDCSEPEVPAPPYGF